MYYLLTSIIVLAAILLTFLVLIQNSKGGGLAASFASGNQVMGAPKTADLLEKASWGFAAVIILLSIIAVWVYKGQEQKGYEDSAIIEQVQEAAESLQLNNAADFNQEAAE